MLFSADKTPPRFSGSPMVQAFTQRDLPVTIPARATAVHPNGLVYVATVDGLLEYDTASWTVIAGTKGMIVHNVAVTKAGQVFYSGADGFGMLVADEQGTLRAKPLQGLLAEADRAVGHVLRLVVCDEEAYFLTQGTQGFIVHADAKGKVEKIQPNGRCSALFLYAGAAHFITDAGMGRIVRGNQIEAVDAPLALRTAGVTSMWTDAENRTWVISAEGLREWAGGNASLVSTEVKMLLEGDRVTCGALLDDGNFLLGSDAHGLMVIDHAGKILNRYKETDSELTTSGKIAAVTPDLSGGVWISHYGGVLRAQMIGSTAVHSLAGHQVRVEAFATHEGHLYVATTRGVFRRDEVSGQFKLLPEGGIDAWAMISTPDGLIVAGDDLRIIKRDGTVQWIDENRLGFRSALLLRRDKNRLVASTGPGGLLRLYHREFTADGTSTWRFEGNAKNVRVPLYPLIEDDAGWLWATRNRLEVMRLDWRQGVDLNAVPERLGRGAGIEGADAAPFRVETFLLHGQVELRTEDQLLRYDSANDRFVAENRIAGHDPTRWPRAYPLSDGSLWIAGKTRMESAVLARPTGVDSWKMEMLPTSGLESIRPQAIADDPTTHTLWFGHLALASVDLNQPNVSPKPPVVQFRRVNKDNGDLLWGGHRGSAAISLTAKDNSLGFTFVAPYFQPDVNGSAKVTYRTHLEGLDKTWSEWSDRTHRDYSNLPPGKFSFHAQARDASGRVGPVAKFEFHLPAPWWRTWWALAGYFVVGLAAVRGLVFLRTRTLQHRADRLTEIIEERTAELVQQNAELSRLHRLELDQKTAARLAEEKARLETLRYQLNPHFLFNALASISSVLPRNGGPAQTMLTRLVDFCRTTLYRGDDREHTTIGEELAQLQAYLDIEKSRWGDLLKIEIDFPEELSAEPLPHFLLLPLVENAIKYGRATSIDHIGLRLQARREAGTTVLVVSNTGEWIESSGSRPSIPSLGIGLTNLRERLIRYYPRSHELAVSHGDGWVHVTLRLNFTPHELSVSAAHAHH